MGSRARAPHRIAVNTACDRKRIVIIAAAIQTAVPDSKRKRTSCSTCDSNPTRQLYQTAVPDSKLYQTAIQTAVPHVTAILPDSCTRQLYQTASCTKQQSKQLFHMRQ